MLDLFIFYADLVFLDNTLKVSFFKKIPIKQFIL